jgi:hypothetical protein
VEIKKRLSEWKLILASPWRWVMLVTFTILGAYQTIQQQFFPELPVRITIPAWGWFLIVLVTIGIVLEGSYRRIRQIRKEKDAEMSIINSSSNINENKVKLENESPKLTIDDNTSGHDWGSLLIRNNSSLVADNCEGILEMLELAQFIHPNLDELTGSYGGLRFVWNHSKNTTCFINPQVSAVLDIIHEEPLNPDKPIQDFHFASEQEKIIPQLFHKPDNFWIFVIGVYAKGFSPVYTLCSFHNTKSEGYGMRIIKSNLINKPSIDECRQMVLVYRGFKVKTKIRLKLVLPMLIDDGKVILSELQKSKNYDFKSQLSAEGYFEMWFRLVTDTLMMDTLRYDDLKEIWDGSETMNITKDDIFSYINKCEIALKKLELMRFKGLV